MRPETGAERTKVTRQEQGDESSAVRVLEWDKGSERVRHFGSFLQRCFKREKMKKMGEDKAGERKDEKILKTHLFNSKSITITIVGSTNGNF